MQANVSALLISSLGSKMRAGYLNRTVPICLPGCAYRIMGMRKAARSSRARAGRGHLAHTSTQTQQNQERSALLSGGKEGPEEDEPGGAPRERRGYGVNVPGPAAPAGLKMGNERLPSQPADCLVIASVEIISLAIDSVVFSPSMWRINVPHEQNVRHGVLNSWMRVGSREVCALDFMDFVCWMPARIRRWWGRLDLSPEDQQPQKGAFPGPEHLVGAMGLVEGGPALFDKQDGVPSTQVPIHCCSSMISSFQGQDSRDVHYLRARELTMAHRRLRALVPCTLHQVRLGETRVRRRGFPYRILDERKPGAPSPPELVLLVRSKRTPISPDAFAWKDFCTVQPIASLFQGGGQAEEGWPQQAAAATSAQVEQSTSCEATARNLWKAPVKLPHVRISLLLDGVATNESAPARALLGMRWRPPLARSARDRLQTKN
ncbi:hypothetical protein CCMA1212_003426 [Trichoderma ghanense]|uniref:Uncharacterized protein n=1 Tax=Trichoderma ghanense TaxID=65468 RepID=A0ABY2H997_9HYPO